MINLFLDPDSPGGVKWTAIRPKSVTLRCYAMDINKQGHVVALLQDGPRHPYLGSWPKGEAHETTTDAKDLIHIDMPFRTSHDGWSEGYQVRLSHELNIVVCVLLRMGKEAEVIGAKLSPDFNTASILFQMQRIFDKSGPLDGQMLAVSSLHFALHQHDPIDNRIDLFNVQNGTVLKTFEFPKCTICDYRDEVPLGMSMSEKKLWIGWGNHRTLLLHFS